MTKTANQLTTLTAALAATAALTGSVDASTLIGTNLGDGAQNLTTIGAADWALYIDGDDTPDEFKNGGSGLNPISLSGAAWSSANSSQSLFVSWTDGTNTASSSGNVDPAHLISTSEDNTASLTTTVTASPTTNSLYVLYGQWNATSRLTASLGDGSAPDYVLDVSGTNDHQTVKIDFASDSVTTLTLTIDFLTNDEDGFTNSTLRFQGLALENVPVPEPGSLALLGLGGLLIGARRRRG